jgi:IS30 family transposase
MASHLTIEERDRIAQLQQQGYSRVAIAQAIGRDRSTISRELRRNAVGGEYLPGQAHRRAQVRRSQRPLMRKLDRPETNEIVRQKLAQFHSPQQITGRLKLCFPDQPKRHVCAQTIYTWIARQTREDRNHWQQFLRRRGRRAARKTPESPEDSARRAAIADRPKVINERQRLGDFEGDTVLGPPGTGGLITLVDRRSRYTIITKTKDKKARRVRRRIQKRLAAVAANKRRSITFDNGTEFAECDRLEQSHGMRIYSSQPGRPYQRGTNENTNGLIRQFFPKGTDFRDISHVAVQEAEKLLNDRPRACLGYRTPNEVFHGISPPTGCD